MFLGARKNWKLMLTLEYLLTIFIMAIAPVVLFLDEANPNKKDLAGTYILMASFDGFLTCKMLLRNRNYAAMITWTQVVTKSMIKFILVSLSFACAPYPVRALAKVSIFILF